MTTISRRTALAAPALLALPSTVLARQAPPQPRDDALARLATFCDVFSKPLAAFPEPMAPDDRAALLAMTADDLEELRDPLLPLAAKYGVSLDWLLCGDVRGLLIHARHGRAKPPHELKPDAAVDAQRDWADARAEYLALFGDMEDTPEFGAAQDREGAALRAFAEASATSWAGVRAKLKLVAYVATDGDVALDFNAHASTLEDLRFGSWSDDIDRSALTTLADGIERLAADGA